MATPAGIISDYITIHDGKDPLDAAMAGRRARLLLRLRQVYNFVYFYRPWECTFTDEAFPIAATNDSGDLSDLTLPFVELSEEGGVWDTDLKIEMDEIDIHSIMAARLQLGTGSMNLRKVFAIFGGRIQLPYTATSTVNLHIFYRFGPPDLADDTDPLVLPDRYASTVFIPGMAMVGQELKHDARQSWAAQFRDGLSQMCGRERSKKGQIQKLPLAYRGAW